MNPIRIVSPEEALEWLRTNSGNRVLEVYANWCIYHFLTVRKVQVLGEILGTDFETASVDVVGAEEQFESVGIDQIPTIVVISNGQRMVWFGDTDVEVLLAGIDQLTSTVGKTK